MRENVHFFNINKSIYFQDLSKIDIFLDKDFEAPFQKDPPTFKEKNNIKEIIKEKSKKDSTK
jgi:hypothetical protein